MLSAKLRKSLVLGWLAIAFFQTACVTSRTGSDREQNLGSPAELKELRLIQTAYQQRAYDEVIKRTKAFSQKFKTSLLLDQIYNYRGLTYLSQKKYPYAVTNFDHVAQLTQNDSLRAMALYNRGFAQFEAGQSDASLKSLSEVKTSSLQGTDRSKFYALLSKVEFGQKHFSESLEAILQASRFHTQEIASYEKSLRDFAEQVAPKVKDLAQIRSFINDYEDSSLADLLLLQSIKLALHEKEQDADLAKNSFRRLQEQYPSSYYLSEARQLLSAAGISTAGGEAYSNLRENPVLGKKIGILLTLSGHFAPFGQKTLHGIQLAAGIFPRNKQLAKPTVHEEVGISSSKVELVIRDDGGEPTQAVRALDELVQKDGVIAVIGPLSSKIVPAVAERAQQLGVPLITLTQKDIEGLSFVFNAALTPHMQVHELVEFATEKWNAKSFAILSPKSRFGDEYARTFWDETEKRGAKMVGFESYPAEETDFRQYVDGLVGLTYPDARVREIQELKAKFLEEQAANKAKKLPRKKEQISLPPIVDFDAVFIPDDPKALGQILPTFEYRDVTNAKYLGVSTWNNEDLLTRAGKHAEGAIFVDGYFPGMSSPYARQFTTDFQAVFGFDPSSLEATGYDAAQILVKLLTSGADSRESIREQMANLRGFPGIAGPISYIDGRLVKKLAILTVRDGKIEEFVTK